MTVLGYPISNKCECGETVMPYHRQQLVFDPEKLEYYRRCEKCLSKDVKEGRSLLASNTTGHFDPRKHGVKR